MSRISTHVLNTVTGKPGAGVRVHLYSGEEKVNSDLTNSDGRCPNLLPDNLPLIKGDYSLQFETDGLFDTCFYPKVTIKFRIDGPSWDYHVPLLISPFGYTTYRGS